MWRRVPNRNLVSQGGTDYTGIDRENFANLMAMNNSVLPDRLRERENLPPPLLVVVNPTQGEEQLAIREGEPDRSPELQDLIERAQAQVRAERQQRTSLERMRQREETELDMSNLEINPDY